VQANTHDEIYEYRLGRCESYPGGSEIIDAGEIIDEEFHHEFIAILDDGLHKGRRNPRAELLFDIGL
jgi:hypothetical protein